MSSRHPQLVQGTPPAITPPEYERYIDDRTLSDLTGIPIGSIRNWRWSKTSGPPFVKIGHLIRYKLSEVNRWLDANTVRPKAGA